MWRKSSLQLLGLYLCKVDLVRRGTKFAFSALAPTAIEPEELSAVGE